MNSPRLVYVLVGSVVLNAFLLGVMSVHFFSRRGSLGGRDRVHAEMPVDAPGEQRGPRLFRDLVRAAGGPRDPRVQALWSGQRGHLGEARKAVFESRELVLQALEREPFDAAALDQALKAADQARERADRVAKEGALELAGKLTPDERRSLRRAATSPDGRRGPRGPRRD